MYTDFPKYPTAIFTDGEFPAVTDDVSWIHDFLINALKKELQAVQVELGTLPKGAYADVKTRLNAAGGVQNNYAAVADPTSSNDSSQGYACGSRWIRTDLDTIFWCVDASVGAAIWRPRPLLALNYFSSPTTTTVSATLLNAGLPNNTYKTSSSKKPARPPS